MVKEIYHPMNPGKRSDRNPRDLAVIILSFCIQEPDAIMVSLGLKSIKM